MPPYIANITPAFYKLKAPVSRGFKLFSAYSCFLMLSRLPAPGAVFLKFDLALHFLLIFGRIISPVFTDFTLQGY